MGREIRCMAELPGWTGDGRLLLETDALIFRGAQKLVIPLPSITLVRAEDGWLVVDHAGGRVRFDLGRLTPSWLNAIANPRSRVDKLDVKPECRIEFVGELDADFVAEVRARAHTVHADSSDVVDLIFFRADALDDLARLPELRTRIRPAGAIWLVHPKGEHGLRHEPIAAAARAAGLIDNKTARFSDTHSAMRLVIPRDQRPKA